MSRTLTASDRSRLIRLASTLPAGSDERKAILAGLAKSAKSAGLSEHGRNIKDVFVELERHFRRKGMVVTNEDLWLELNISSPWESSGIRIKPQGQFSDPYVGGEVTVEFWSGGRRHDSIRVPRPSTRALLNAIIALADRQNFSLEG